MVYLAMTIKMSATVNVGHVTDYDVDRSDGAAANLMLRIAETVGYDADIDEVTDLGFRNEGDYVQFFLNWDRKR